MGKVERVWGKKDFSPFNSQWTTIGEKNAVALSSQYNLRDRIVVDSNLDCVAKCRRSTACATTTASWLSFWRYPYTTKFQYLIWKHWKKSRRNLISESVWTVFVDHRLLSLKVPNVEFNFDVSFSTLSHANNTSKYYIKLLICMLL